MMTSWQKSREKGNQTLLDGLPNVDANVQRCRRTGTLDKMQDMVLEEEEDEEDIHI